VQKVQPSNTVAFITQAQSFEEAVLENWGRTLATWSNLFVDATLLLTLELYRFGWLL